MPFPPQNPNYPVPGYVGQPVPGNWQPALVNAPAPRMPVAAAMAAGVTNPSAAPRPTIRLQAPDTLLVRPPVPVVLASPEALGIRLSPPEPAAVAPLDWNNAHARLQRLGALGFHLDRLAQGDVRVTFMLSDGDRRAHQIEVVAGSESAAVTAALENAEAWASGQK
ncbi:MAG TPA: hypothetical protein VNX28_16530 [Gemmataceae bacterium]|jgi:hypothetical protein|nr:hypothetical protein [Gemmataceae bacterium]